MAIEQLTLRNFQCHKNLTIKFSPTVTTLVGPNDSGKSAILRALRYVLLNKPRGTSHVRRKSKSCRVSVTIDGREIRRTSGKANSYTLDGKRFVAFRNEVPQEIRRVVNVTEINFQRQHDPVFWLALSPGQLAKELNRLVDLETIDRVQAWIVRKQRTNTTANELTKQRIDAATAVCGQLKSIKKIRNAFDNLTNLRNLTPRITAQIRVIREVIDSVSNIDAFLRGTAQTASIAHTLHVQARELSRCRTSAAGLQAVIRDCVHCQAAIRQRIDPQENAELERLSRDIGSLVTQVQDLRQLVRRTSFTQKEINRCHLHAKHKRTKIEKELNGRCPLCGGILTNESPV